MRLPTHIPLPRTSVHATPKITQEKPKKTQEKPEKTRQKPTQTQKTTHSQLPIRGAAFSPWRVGFSPRGA